MGMSILYGGSFLPTESNSETFLYFSLRAQDHIMRPGQSYYRADMGWAQAHIYNPGPRTNAQELQAPRPRP